MGDGIVGNLASIFMSPECYKTYFHDYYFWDVVCFQAVVSKLLGYCIIVGSALVKAPQIIKILTKNNAQGISIVAQFFELLAVVANVSYNFVRGFPFSSWGDGAFMLVQTSTVIVLIIYYSHGRNNIKCISFVISLLILLVCLTQATSVNTLWIFQAISVPIMFTGKMYQASKNFAAKDMGQQSVITAVLMFCGSLARVFTSIHETGDLIMIATYTVASAANAIIVHQFYIYRKLKPKKNMQKKKKY